MAEKTQMSQNTSGSLLSGGPLAVENTSVVQNKGVRFDVGKNASISTFQPSVLTSFLKYPTILYEGSVSSTTPIGANIYATPVSPSLLKSTSLSRIANFATNFRQWNGAMTARLIFTKPIFVQTKVIAAYIPGASESEIDTISIADMYGAQYHCVMNPDNDNELSFKIPFVSGRNWLPMTVSSGLFLVKLFQPLIASQPTNVANVTIPFTITISSNSDMSDEAKLAPLDFRYLVAPTYQNQIIKRDFQEIIINSISPQIKSANTNKYSAIVPRNQFESNRAKSMVLLPVSKLGDYQKQIYDLKNESETYAGDFRKSPCSLDSTQDLLFTDASGFYLTPLDYSSFTGHELLLYPNVPLNDMTIDYKFATSESYGFSVQNEDFRLLINTHLATAPVGKYYSSLLAFSAVGVDASIACKGSITVEVAHLDDGTYNYLIIGTDRGSIQGTTAIDFTRNFCCRFSTFKPGDSSYNEELQNMKSLISADKFDYANTHALFYSSVNKEDTQIDVSKSNYTNLTPVSQDLMSASFSDRAITSAELLSEEDSGFEERINFVTLLMSLKVGADFIAKASRVTSNVLSYLIPILKINGRAVGPNQTIVLDLTGSDAVYLERSSDRRTINEHSEVNNPNIIVV